MGPAATRAQDVRCEERFRNVADVSGSRGKLGGSGFFGVSAYGACIGTAAKDPICPSRIAIQEQQGALLMASPCRLMVVICLTVTRTSGTACLLWSMQ